MVDAGHTCRDLHAAQPVAPIKRFLADAGHRRWDLHVSQPAAPPKCTKANSGHTSRNLHAGKPAAPTKRIGADALKLGSCLKGHAGQHSAPRKRSRADAGHRRRNLHAGKPPSITIIKRTSADAGHTIRNYQVALHQLSIDVQNITIIREVIPLVPLTPAGKVSLVIYSQIAAAIKRQRADAGHRRRNPHAGKSALKKRSLADIDHTRWYLHAGKPTATFKRILADAGEAGGLGQVQANLGRCFCGTNLAFQGADGGFVDFICNNYLAFPGHTGQI